MYSVAISPAKTHRVMSPIDGPSNIESAVARSQEFAVPVRRGSPYPAKTTDRRSPPRPRVQQNAGDLGSNDIGAGSGDPRTTRSN